MHLLNTKEAEHVGIYKIVTAEKQLCALDLGPFVEIAVNSPYLTITFKYVKFGTKIS